MQMLAPSNYLNKRRKNKIIFKKRKTERIEEKEGQMEGWKEGRKERKERGKK